MIVHGRHMASLLVPVAKVVIGHDSNPVKVLGDLGNVVASIDDLLAGRDGGRKQKVVGLEGLLELSNPSSEALLVTLAARLALSLPAGRVFPVKVKTVKVVLEDEVHNMLDELGPGGGVVDQPAVLVTLGIVPPANGNGDLDALCLESSDLLIEFCKNNEA